MMLSPWLGENKWEPYSINEPTNQWIASHLLSWCCVEELGLQLLTEGQDQLPHLNITEGKKEKSFMWAIPFMKQETKRQRTNHLYLLIKFVGDEGSGWCQRQRHRRFPLPGGHQLFWLVGSKQLAKELWGGQPNPAVGVAEVGFSVACGEREWSQCARSACSKTGIFFLLQLDFHR